MRKYVQCPYTNPSSSCLVFRAVLCLLTVCYSANLRVVQQIISYIPLRVEVRDASYIIIFVVSGPVIFSAEYIEERITSNYYAKATIYFIAVTRVCVYINWEQFSTH
jgi:hypothetical protein